MAESAARFNTRAEVALLRALGFAVCKPNPGTKKPTYTGWSTRSLEPDDFREGDLVGPLAGPLSDCNRPGHALVIVDLDDPLAVEVADHFLPGTDCMEGRDGKPLSHRYYSVPCESIPPWAESTADQAAAAARQTAGHPGPFLKHFKHPVTKKGVLDFLGTGAQAVCPPSVHAASGQRRRWATGRPEPPTVVPFVDLWEATCELAAECGAKTPETGQARPEPQRTGAGTPFGRLRPEDRADVLRRAVLYLATIDPAVSGQGGHDGTYWPARAMVYGFDLGPEVGFKVLWEYFNPRCQPPWTEAELRHKCADADTKACRNPRGWLRERQRDGGKVPPRQTGPEGEEARRFNFVGLKTFLTGDYRQEYFIPRVLARNQPGVVGGPSKTLKTSIALDEAISMATATPFLGTFPVRKRSRVAVVSGESGRSAICKACARILAARGLSVNDVDDEWMHLEFTLPTFTDASVMTQFADELARLEADVVFIDPLYLALGEVDARSVFEMGRALRAVAEGLLSRGTTPVLLHHANRHLAVGEQMTLERLSYAGLAEFSRQWLLLNRRELWQGDGVSELSMNVGSSEGHGGLWEVRVEEGVADEHGEGRRWDVTVAGTAEAIRAKGDRREEEKQETGRKRNAADEAAVLKAIDGVLARGKDPPTFTFVRSISGISNDKARAAVDRLLHEGGLVEVDVTIATGKGRGTPQTVKGLRRPPVEAV